MPEQLPEEGRIDHEPFQYRFGRLTISAPSKYVPDVIGAETFLKLENNPQGRIPHFAKLHISPNLERLETVRHKGRPAALISEAGIGLMKDLKADLAELAGFIKAHPTSWVATADFFYGISRLADVNDRVAGGLGFKIFPMAETDGLQSSSSRTGHDYAAMSYRLAGMDAKKAEELSEKRETKLALLSKEELMRLY